MKKHGFTLAEVLITLGIIGVVAALAAPALVTAVQKSKVPPALRKFMSTMEVANESMLNNFNSDSISMVITENKASTTETEATAYARLLNQQVKGAVESKKYSELVASSASDTSKPPKISQYGVTTDATVDANSNVFSFSSGESLIIKYVTPDATKAEGSYKGVVADVYYDINGLIAKPNKLGKDVFRFLIDDNGSIYPYGGKQNYTALKSTETTYRPTKEQAWKDDTNNPCNVTSVKVGTTCAASIAENDWKIVYKY